MYEYMCQHKHMHSQYDVIRDTSAKGVSCCVQCSRTTGEQDDTCMRAQEPTGTLRLLLLRLCRFSP